MSIFGKATTNEPEVTATEALRLRVWSRQRRAHLARTASDLQISLPALEAFAQGKGTLPEAAMHALTKEFFINARFDPVSDRLVDTGPPPIKMGTPPKPYDPRSNPNFVQHDPNRRVMGPVFEKPEPAKRDPFKRPGFAA